MAQTGFQDWEDKQLVQIALQFDVEGLRIPRDYIARRMVKMKRSATELLKRLASLKKTYGKRIKGLPRCFFSGVKRAHSVLSPGAVQYSQRPRPATARRPQEAAPTRSPQSVERDDLPVVRLVATARPRPSGK
ncbi:hypothetical protein PI126_g11782 [Phytophthora idaei]|nr:hypothetical protein PI126_g11782 [Phytophthora idaei]